MDDSFATHDVFNQSPALEDVNLFNSDRALMEAVQREGAGHAAKRLAAFGQICGSADALLQGRLANEHPPRLKAFDAKGRRLDIVEFHPAYHACMEISVKEGLHCSAWDHLATPGAKPVQGANVAQQGHPVDINDVISEAVDRSQLPAVQALLQQVEDKSMLS